MIRSLRGRVFAATLIASVAAVGIALAIGVVTTRSAVRDSYKRETLREATVLASRLSVSGGNLRPDEQGSGTHTDGVQDALDGRAADGGASGDHGPTHGAAQAVADTPSRQLPLVLPLSGAKSVLPDDAASKVLQRKIVTGRFYVGSQSRLFAAAPVAGHDVYVLATRADNIGTGEYGKYLTGLVLAALVAVALSAAAAALLARRLTRPISKVVAASSELAAGRTPERLEVPETSELAELASSFNNMADQLARAREAERTVLMSASHELRTPLTAISGYAEGIEDGTIDARTGAAVIVSEASRLERLVQDLLVLARLEQGTFETRRERVDLGKIAATAAKRLALRADEAEVALDTEVAPGSFATADADRVLQIVTNLVDNAVRITPRGGNVTISGRPGEIVVADTGPGIPADDLPHVFERFHMRKRRGMGSPDGSGIGLAIAHELSEAMGGAVSVESTEGQGTIFTVTLPTADAAR